MRCCSRMGTMYPGVLSAERLFAIVLKRNDFSIISVLF
jgi:hypothetical protein